MTELTITKKVCFRLEDKGRKAVREKKSDEPKPLGSVPRISRLMALAIHMQDLIQDGDVQSYAELAKLCFVTPARITQIMNLLHLAPDIQEEILHLPPGDGGRDAVSERAIRSLVSIVDWRKQRKVWNQIGCRLKAEGCRP